MLIMLKRGFLIGLLVLIGLAVLVCVGTILMGTGGRREETAMESGLTWAYLLALAFSGFYVMDRGVTWLKIWAGMGLIWVALAVIVTPIYFWWQNFIRYSGTYTSYSATRNYGDWVATLVIAASWMILVPLVMSPRMPLFPRLIQLATAASMSIAAGLMLYFIWNHYSSRDLEKVLEVAVILAIAGALGVLVLSRFVSIKLPDALTTVRSKIWLRCPRCAKEQDMETGESRCESCRLKIKLEVEEPKCEKCGYRLQGLTRPICPECGNLLRPEEVTGKTSTAAFPS